MTISGSWGYFRDENTWKTNHELLTLLITATSRGGNLILNVGPTARGYFDYRAQRALDSMATWMKYNNKAIYNCRQAPEGFAVPEKTLLTYNPATKRIYIHLMEYHTKTLVLPGYKDKIKYSQFLHDASEVRYKEQGNDIVLTLPTCKPNVDLPVIELVLR